jgi:hypothetical protein
MSKSELAGSDLVLQSLRHCFLHFLFLLQVRPQFLLLNYLRLLRLPRPGLAQLPIAPPPSILPCSKSLQNISLYPEFQNDCVERSKPNSLDSSSERKSSTSAYSSKGNNDCLLRDWRACCLIRSARVSPRLKFGTAYESTGQPIIIRSANFGTVACS